MKKLTIRIAALCSIVSGSMVHATAEFRSPIILERGEMHFRLAPLKETWWYDAVTADVESCRERCNVVDFWAGAYSRWADRSFFKDEVDCDGNRNHGTTKKTTGLSHLWFGKEAFKGVDAFAGDSATPQLLATAPVLNFARIFPNFTYSEQGVYWGLYTRRDFGCEDKWHVGTRISIPFKVIEVQQRGCVLEEGLDDVYVRRTMDLDSGATAGQIDEYAARLDFLSSLELPTITGGVVDGLVPFVQYGNGVPAGANNGRTLIGALLVDAATPFGPVDDAAPGAQPPVYAIRRAGGAPSLCGPVDGTVPNAPFRKTADDVTGAIAGDGSGGVNNSVLFFELGTDYADGLGEDNAAQTDLWIVPRRQIAVDVLVPGAVAIGDAIANVVADDEGLLDASAVETLCRLCDINLCADRRVEGLGDLMTEFYFGYGHPDECFLDGLIAVLWPTGKKQKNAGDVFFQSTGHWRHFELKLGMEGGWKPIEWFAFQFEWIYNHAFERRQPKAAPFKGATVRNIGPDIDAKVKWDYWTFNADFNFFHPCNPELGVVIGYELFSKQHDRIHLACSDIGCGGGFALDCLGNLNELDFAVLENGTNSLTHKLRGEIFHRVSFWEVTAGASRVVAGRNAMQETEIHLALRLYF